VGVRPHCPTILGEARELSTANEDELVRSKRRAWWHFNAAISPDDPDDRLLTGTYISTLRYAQSCVEKVIITEENIDEIDCLGLWHPGRNDIWIWGGLNMKGRIKTMIHEIAHWMTWPNPPDIFTDLGAPQRYREQVAEAVAFVVSKWLGVDTHDYSLIYIALCLKGADRHIIKVSGIYKCCSIIAAGINARRIRING
jgi:hypothetical protein